MDNSPRLGVPGTHSQRGRGRVEVHSRGSSLLTAATCREDNATGPLVAAGSVPSRRCTRGICVHGGLSVSLKARVLFDPPSQRGDPAVDARLLLLCTAIAPAHDASQEHPTVGFHADQWPSRVSLHKNKQYCKHRLSTKSSKVLMTKTITK